MGWENLVEPARPPSVDERSHTGRDRGGASKPAGAPPGRGGGVFESGDRLPGCSESLKEAERRRCEGEREAPLKEEMSYFNERVWEVDTKEHMATVDDHV